MEIIGLDRLKTKLNNITGINVRDAISKSCYIVETDAKKNCPVDTGTLRRSITSEIHDKYGEVGTNVEYAPYVEYGTGIFASNGDGRQDAWSYQDAKGEWHTTSGSRPQPFLMPALTTNRSRIEKIFQDEVRKAIND